MLLYYTVADKYSIKLLRETIGVETCNRRGSKNYIHDRYPNYTIPADFSEKDRLWVADLQESFSAQTERLNNLLDEISNNDDQTYISFTTHAQSINAILEIVGHRHFSLPTGGVIPIFVRLEKKPGPRPKRTVSPWSPPPKCDTSPTPTPQL